MRFQLALNVRDLDEAIDYYSKLFGTPVNKRRARYANFSIEQPPLKLVLFEKPDATDRLNHVGFEAFDNAVVEAQIERLEPLGLVSKVIRGEHCCYAHKNTVYAHDPQGLMWEFYKVLGDDDSFGRPGPEAPSGEDSARAEKGRR